MVNNHELIPALLAFCKEKGLDSVSLTALIKYLYLIDCYSAEMLDGQGKATDIEWKFIKFGPHSFSVQPVIDELTQKGIILCQQHDYEERAFNTYSLNNFHTAKKLKDIGFPSYVTSRLSSDIKKHKNKLPSLLNKVYFETEPMKSALPYEDLHFSSCYKKKIEHFKTKKTKPLSHDSLSKGKEIIAKINEKYLKSATNKMDNPDKYDSIYYNGMAELFESDEWRDGTQGSFKVKL